MKTNRYNYLFGLLTGTSAYKNSAGNASWAREELIREYFGWKKAEYIALLALHSTVNISMRDYSVGNSGKKSGSSSSGCNCFVAGTKVQTDEGEKPIEDIEVGDKVLSKNEENGEVAYKEVTETLNHETDEITRFMWAVRRLNRPLTIRFM
ncbi:polymorphic toxin-type HINT domain-containing protein [Paenibacillus sp. sgz5001063]|uniref:polymorphic toxin-type HINT domain-containing protein n=1 Tax=Paenibacillus sp. sgz5001063 TaxID=3242474 RepID=UPI0036D3967D